MNKKYLIDTSSLLSLVRYYSPFDKDKILYNFLKEQFLAQNIILIEEVFEECKFVAQGLVIAKLDFFEVTKLNKSGGKNKIPAKFIQKSNCLITNIYHNKIDNHWVISRQRERLSDEEYQTEKDNFTEGADCQLILNALENTQEYTIVTEESKRQNDGKLFKKIPIICADEGVRCIAFPELLKELNISIDFINLDRSTESLF